MGALGSILAKILAALFGEWRRDQANRSLGAADLRADTAIAALDGYLKHMEKANAVDRAVLDGDDPDWLRRVRARHTTPG